MWRPARAVHAPHPKVGALPMGRGNPVCPPANARYNMSNGPKRRSPDKPGATIRRTAGTLGLSVRQSRTCGGKRNGRGTSRGIFRGPVS